MPRLSHRFKRFATNVSSLNFAPKAVSQLAASLDLSSLRTGLYVRAAVPLCRWQMHEPPILYSFRRCPYAMRGRMALIASGVAYEHREILLRDKPAAMLAASPKGTVPVLVLANGQVIDESIDIMRWSLDQNDPEGWMAAADAGLVADYDGDFKRHLDYYKYAARHGENPLMHRAAGLAMLCQLDAKLGDRNYLGGSARGFSDIAIFPFVRQFAGVDPEWFEAEAPQTLRRWLEGLISSDLFGRAMIRHPLWTAAAS